MITLENERRGRVQAHFVFREEAEKKFESSLKHIFSGKYKEYCFLPEKEGLNLFIGLGEKEDFGLLELKEVFATLSGQCADKKIESCFVDFRLFKERFGEETIGLAALGLRLGTYRYTFKKKEEECRFCTFAIGGVRNDKSNAEALKEAEELAKSILFARDMVNMPGNHLRPMDFARKILEFMGDVDTENKTIVYGQLKAMKMEALYGIGGSSEFPPCLLVLKYKGNPNSKEVYGLIGKGVTCDTGGYSLKPASSMAGIKGDMGGAAAVVGALHAAAGKGVKVNVTAVLPLCENRISPASHLPGDVITSYGGKTIEILNTDAEGRLVMSDAMCYAIKDEGATKLLDIATLTGAVWSALGYTVAGTLSNDDAFYADFEKGAKKALERYLRFPYGKEHRKLLESNVADIKNIGGAYCGAITAGVFMKEFCDGKPWIHVDIAGTAWNDTAQYDFDDKGATGAGVATLYYFLKELEKK